MAALASEVGFAPCVSDGAGETEGVSETPEAGVWGAACVSGRVAVTACCGAGTAEDNCWAGCVARLDFFAVGCCGAGVLDFDCDLFFGAVVGCGAGLGLTGAAFCAGSGTAAGCGGAAGTGTEGPFSISAGTVGGCSAFEAGASAGGLADAARAIAANWFCNAAILEFNSWEAAFSCFTMSWASANLALRASISLCRLALAVSAALMGTFAAAFCVLFKLDI